MKQKLTIKEKVIGFVAGVGLGLAALTGSASADTQKTDLGYLFRTRTEVVNQGDSTSFKNTLGISPYSEKHSNFSEFFRAYEFTGKANGESDDMNYTNWGLNLPDFSVGGVDNSVSVFGLTGDRQGLGIQSVHDIGNTNLVLNLEKENQLGRDSKRIGFGVDQRLNDKLVAGIGYDEVKTSEGKTKYFLGKITLDASKTDQMGIGFSIKDFEGNKTNSIGGHWLHYGKDEKWGTRTRVKYDWDNQTDFKGISFESIVAQNPAFSKPCAYWIVGRDQNEMYSAELFAAPQLVVEREPLADRVRDSGWAAEIKGNIREQEGERSGYVKTDIGYTFKRNKSGIRSSFTGFYRNDVSELNNDSVGASALIDIGSNFRIETSHEVPSQGESRTYCSAQAIWEF